MPKFPDLPTSKPRPPVRVIFRDKIGKLLPKPRTLLGTLGNPTGEVLTDNSALVWVTVNRQTVRAFRGSAPLIYGLWVELGYDLTQPSLYRIIQYWMPTDLNMLPALTASNHHEDHEFLNEQ